MSLIEYKMTHEEMAEILKINKEGSDPVMFISGGSRLGKSLRQKINDYWLKLGIKYGFNSSTVRKSPKGGLFFIAEKSVKK